MEYMIMPFKRYFDFNGRSRRMEYWMFTLLNIIVAAVLAGPAYYSIFSNAMAAGGGEPDMAASMGGLGTGGTIGLSLYGLYALAAFIPGIMVAIRRLHDRNMSGWWLLGFVVLSLIPLLGIFASIAMLVIFFLPGTNGPNRFGDDPKNPSAQADVFD